MNGGVCVQDGNSFICQCEAGYEGTLCEMDTDDCEDDLCYGVCVDQIAGYTCECEAGRSGRHCMRVMTPCHENNCTNGLCVMGGPGTLISFHNDTFSNCTNITDGRS